MTDFRFARNVLLKTLLLLLLANLIFAALNPLPALARLSAYNVLFPGRERLPFGERPDLAYNLSLFSLDAMLASHEANQDKQPGEYRVLVVGDSSVWGTLLTNEQTLTGQINAARLTLPDGRSVRAYNLGYPTISLTKDLVLLTRLARFQPDMVLWLTTLEAFPRTRQLTSPVLQRNPEAVRSLIDRFDLSLDAQDPALVDPSLWDRTIFGQRRALADVFRLQMYGVLWSSTGIDQYIPDSYEPRANDLPADTAFQGLQPPRLNPDDLSLDVLAAGMSLFPDLPVILINEPMFTADGENSDIRYNFFYPRWAYDNYRQIMQQQAAQYGWRYLDLWDAVPSAEFTNSAIHLSPAGSTLLAGRVGAAILENAGVK